MIAPHTSCRYAVVFAEAFEPEAEGYAVAAVHAIDADGDPMVLLVSRVNHPSTSLAFGQPTWVRVAQTLSLAADFKDASNLRLSLVEEDRRAETYFRPCANHEERRATVAYAPGVYLCNDCAVDAQRAEER